MSTECRCPPKGALLKIKSRLHKPVTQVMQVLIGSISGIFFVELRLAGIWDEALRTRPASCKRHFWHRRHARRLQPCSQGLAPRPLKGGACPKMRSEFLWKFLRRHLLGGWGGRRKPKWPWPVRTSTCFLGARYLRKVSSAMAQYFFFSGGEPLGGCKSGRMGHPMERGQFPFLMVSCEPLHQGASQPPRRRRKGFFWFPIEANQEGSRLKKRTPIF